MYGEFFSENLEEVSEWLRGLREKASMKAGGTKRQKAEAARVRRRILLLARSLVEEFPRRPFAVFDSMTTDETELGDPISTWRAVLYPCIVLERGPRRIVFLVPDGNIFRVEKCRSVVVVVVVAGREVVTEELLPSWERRRPVGDEEMIPYGRAAIEALQRLAKKR